MEKVTALYVSVSKDTQSLEKETHQTTLEDWCRSRNLTSYVVYQDEHQIGKKRLRPALDKMMKDAREGRFSQVVVYSLSEFARSVSHFLAALMDFKEMNIDFISIAEEVDTDSPLGKALFTSLETLATLEHDLIVNRARDGLANAKAHYKKIGRVKTRPSGLIRALLKTGMSHRKIAKTLNISHGSVSLERKEILNENAAS